MNNNLQTKTATSRLLCELMDVATAATTVTSKEDGNKSKNKMEITEALQKAKAELIVVQKYSLKEVYDSDYNNTGLSEDN